MKVFPVIHHLDFETTFQQVSIAFQYDVQGVFLISHDGRDDEMDESFDVIKSSAQGKFIGVNYLSVIGPKTAIDRASQNRYQAVWIDDVGICNGMVEYNLQFLTHGDHQDMEIFGCVAFKYQKQTVFPGEDAKLCRDLGMIPTTSGPRTGAPPDLDKIIEMSEAAGGTLAVASGLTAENVKKFKPYVSHALVATGISKDMHHLDPVLLAKFIDAVR